ncbi:hypothetical protein Bhyg_12758 [Pseudolycoriella hygida]|uniref:DUF7726 domain-containing protein n=1 Tax=Pseudolycoriella hygida TaxID=35572 RepID=A0A9Q0MZ04_9DIPT|nr:hypothetical protein Bhyg_12758 [Pseudolycoriella hygida]
MDQHRDLNSKRTTDTTSVERTSSNSSSHDKHHIYRILGLEKTTDTENVESCREPPNQSAAFDSSPNIHQPQGQFLAPSNFLNAYERYNQIVAPYYYASVRQPFGIPNVNQPQRQVGTPYNIALAFERPNQTVFSHNYANVRHPQWQVGAPFGIYNVNQPQRQVGTSYNTAHTFERQDQIVLPYKNPTVDQSSGQIAAYGNCPYVSEPQSLSDAPDILQQLDDIPNSANSPEIFDRQSVRRFKQLYGPVFDDCDEVRRKIKEYIFKISSSETTFARAINVHPASLKHFLGQEGFNRGAGSIAYPAAYYHFEKMRIDHHEGKSENRRMSEKRFPYGYELTRDYVPTWWKF